MAQELEPFLGGGYARKRFRPAAAVIERRGALAFLLAKLE
jgi:hypothetical protein